MTLRDKPGARIEHFILRVTRCKLRTNRIPGHLKELDALFRIECWRALYAQRVVGDLGFDQVSNSRWQHDHTAAGKLTKRVNDFGIKLLRQYLSRVKRVGVGDEILAALRSLYLHGANQSVHHGDFSGQLPENFADLWHVFDSVGSGDHTSYACQESQLHFQANLSLIVLINVCRRLIKLFLAHRDISRDENTLPGDFYFIEVEDSVIFIELV